MKKLNKTIIILLLFAMLFQNLYAIASVINIGETKYVERGDLGFYTIQYWNESKQQWMYVTYSRTYYTDDNGQKRIAYCTSPDLDGVGWLPGEVEGYDTTVKSKVTDEKLWRVFKNGYPYVSPTELGVETDDDAYLATKQAVYFILRGRRENEVYDYFRAGESEINGQNLSDIKRRGQKVVDAIYKLVNIGQNGNQKMGEMARVVPNGEFDLDKDTNYYSQKYSISKEGEDTEVKIYDFYGQPNGTFCADENGNKKDTFKNGDSFKIMVPKGNILRSYVIQVKYKRTCKNYPIYYAKSTIENRQDYLMMAEKYESENSEFGIVINGFKSELKIKKVDANTKNPISGVKFKVEHENVQLNDNIITTDQNGEASFGSLPQGKVTIREQSTDDNYVLDTTPKEVFIGYNQIYNIEIENTRKKGSLEILKVDKNDENKKLKDTEFDLIDNDGKIITHKSTDENGLALFDDVNVGTYTLKETKATNGYRVAEEQKVTINYGEKLSIIVKDEQQKGKIKITKVDKENIKIKLSNVEFKILDNNKNELLDVVTDENGEVTTNELPVGKYYIQEIKSNDNYVLDEKIQEIEVKDNTISELKVENEKKKGKIRIIKTSEDANNIIHTDADTPISDVKFGIYYFNGNIAQEVLTGKDGIAISYKLPIGKYKIKELDSGKWYIINNNIYEAEIKENEEIAEVDVKDKSVDPKIEIKKVGPQMSTINKEINYEFDIKNTGNVEISQFIWYDFLPYEHSKITKISTGTYNQDIKYNIYYKTNKKTDYMILSQNLDSKTNNYIDVSKVYLDEDEKIVEIKVDFGNVEKEFCAVEKPNMYVKIDNDVEDGFSVINETILEGYYEDYKISAEDTATTTIENKPEEIKRLPRTGK